jgi:hypothetical protein
VLHFLDQFTYPNLVRGLPRCRDARFPVARRTCDWDFTEREELRWPGGEKLLATRIAVCVRADGNVKAVEIWNAPSERFAAYIRAQIGKWPFVPPAIGEEEVPFCIAGAPRYHSDALGPNLPLAQRANRKSGADLELFRKATVSGLTPCAIERDPQLGDICTWGPESGEKLAGLQPVRLEYPRVYVGWSSSGVVTHAAIIGVGDVVFALDVLHSMLTWKMARRSGRINQYGVNGILRWKASSQ